MSLDINAITTFLFTIIKVSTPIIYGALGICMTRQAGLMNLAGESMMVGGALCGVIASGYLHSLGLGIIGGLAGGIIVAMIVSYAAFRCKTDLYLTCIAVNTAMTGGSILVMYLLTGQKTNTIGYIDSKVMPSLSIPVIENIPVLGTILSGHNLFTYLAVLFLAFEWFLLFKTKIGLRIRAVGQNPKAAETVGISPQKIYFLAYGLCGAFSAMAGMFMSMGYLQWFARDMMGGRGFISMSAATVAGAHPLGAAGVAVIFGFSDAVANYAQLFGLPFEFAYMFPYAATIVLLVLITIFKQMRARKRLKKRISEVTDLKDY